MTPICKEKCVTHNRRKYFKNFTFGWYACCRECQTWSNKIELSEFKIWLCLWVTGLAPIFFAVGFFTSNV